MLYLFLGMILMMPMLILLANIATLSLVIIYRWIDTQTISLSESGMILVFLAGLLLLTSMFDGFRRQELRY
jgi:hypothetical protein